MLTLVLHGGAEDAQQAASLAFNLGVKILVVDARGVEVVAATPMQMLNGVVEEVPLVEAGPGLTPVSSASIGVGLDPVLVGHDGVTVAEGSGLPSFSELLAQTTPAKDVDGVPVDEPHPVFEKEVADVVPAPVPDVVVEPDAGPSGEVPVVETPAE